ncbi:MAG: hypothetical protein Q4C48_08950 [Lachnospiraceae bacterium]|nr:hypothetical protein [Lachnospiraceae bacterium]
MLIPYTDYAFYAHVYKGSKLTEEQWERLAIQASVRIKNRMLGVGGDVPVEVQYCCCELAELLQSVEENRETFAGIASEKDGSWSVSYESSEARANSTERQVAEIIDRWLAAAGLLYSGVTVI